MEQYLIILIVFLFFGFYSKKLLNSEGYRTQIIKVMMNVI